jgi:hypothetical protein
MRVRRWSSSARTLSLSIIAIVGFTPALMAQRIGVNGGVTNGGRQLFEWNGRVDREVRIAMRGREAWTEGAGRNNNSRGRAEIISGLPRTDGEVRVRVEDGRGDVDVVQQPSPRNDYTAIVRIRDRSNGADVYRVRGYWWNEERGDWNNGRDRDNDRWDPDDRRARSAFHALRWSGRVDDGLEIRIQGDRIASHTTSGKGTRDVRADLLQRGLPRTDGELRVEMREGRGRVEVVQQPSSWNNYTALIRVYDPRSGYGSYDFDVVWRPTNGRR